MSATGGQPAIWGSVPMRNPHFTGRAGILDRLRERLAGAAEETQVLYALQGLGGIGKTQLAVEYAHRHKGDYDLVWWISAEDPTMIRASLAALAAELGLTGERGDIATAERHALEALRTGHPHRRWLLVYDNAADPDQIAKHLPAGGGHVLITSRGGQWRHGADGLEIDVFDRDESIAFLARRVPGLPGSDAGRIADALGDLPLALEQAAALRVESGMSTRDFLDQLRDREKDLLSMLGESRPVGYSFSVATVWSLSVSQLQRTSPDSLELLRRLSIFGPEPIPLRILTESRHVLDGDFGQILTEPLRLQRALRGLARYSLARVDTARNTVQVHRMMQLVQRKDLPDAEVHRVRHEVHLLLAARAPSDPDDSAGWPVFDGFLGHVLHSRTLTCRKPAVRRFSVSFARYLYVRGDYEGSNEFAREAIDRWQAEPADPEADPRDDPNVLAMRLILGVNLRLLGELKEAHELNQETMARMTAVLGQEHEETLRILNSHGGDLRALGLFRQARELDETTLALHQRVLGTEDPWTLMAANNLALDCRLTSDYARALELDRETLERRLRLYGRQDNHWVIFSRNQVSRDLRELGRYAESAEHQRLVFADYQTVLDRDHANVLRAQKNLSVSLRKAGLYEEARQLAEDVRRRYERRFGPSHLDTLAASCNLVNDLRLAGEPAQARELGTDTLSRYAETLGADHPFTHGCATNLAAVLRRLGSPEAAAELNERARASLAASIGADHHYTLTAAINLASDRAALGEPAAAREIAEDVLGRAADGGSLSADHPYMLACQANLAADLRAAGQRERATELGDAAVRTLADRLGAAHPLAEEAARGERIDCDFEPPPV